MLFLETQGLNHLSCVISPFLPFEPPQAMTQEHLDATLPVSNTKRGRIIKRQQSISVLELQYKLSIADSREISDFI